MLFFLGSIVTPVKSYNCKMKAKHMLSGKEIDTVCMRALPFFVPTFSKRVTSLCSGCRVGNNFSHMQVLFAYL